MSKYDYGGKAEKNGIALRGNQREKKREREKGEGKRIKQRDKKNCP